MTSATAQMVDLSALFEPRSVAVVGASESNRWSRAALENFADLGFAGSVGAVNPRYETVCGVPCVPALGELAFVPDAVVVSVGSERVIPVLREAAEIGVKVAVVFGIGFAETGDAGRARQAELEEIAAASGMLVLGPNCQGIVNFVSSTALYLDYVRPYKAGAIGLIAQSGSIGTALVNNRRGVRWRYAVSSGNEAVITAADLLWHMVRDERCKLICLFLEAIREPDKFFAACDEALADDKPIVVVKTGRTESSVSAAEAHSGVLSAPDRLIDARLERHGVVRVRSLEEMLETANALALGHRPTNGGVATITASGGQIEMMLDSSDEAGLVHPPLAPSTVTGIRSILPDFLPATNPLDFWGVANLDVAYPALLRLLADDPAVEIVLAVIDQADEPTGFGRFQQQLDEALALAPSRKELLVLLETIGGSSPPERIEQTAGAGVLMLSGFDAGLRALANLIRFSRRQAAVRPVPAVPQTVAALPRDRAFSGLTALEYMSDLGVTVAPTRTASDAQQAITAARELGFPVVVKLADERITHKTEAAGVFTNLLNETEVETAVESLRAAGHEEVLVQPQLSGVELILGISRDPQLGAFLIVGLGGTWTEVLDDVVIVPAGLAPGEPRQLLGRLKGSPLLAGARGIAPVDMDALTQVIEALDRMALGLGDQLASVDLNPVFAGPNGAWAVDALIVPAEQPVIPAERQPLVTAERQPLAD